MESSPHHYSASPQAMMHKRRAQRIKNMRAWLLLAAPLVFIVGINELTPAPSTPKAQKTQSTPAAEKQVSAEQSAQPAASLMEQDEESITRTIAIDEKNIYAFLRRYGFNRRGSHDLVNQLRPFLNPMHFYKVSKIALSYHSDTQAHPLPLQMRLHTKEGYIITATRYSDASYRVTQEKEQKHIAVTLKAEGVIRHPLAKSLALAGVPRDVVTQVIKALSFSIDLQREIARDDSYQIMYETLRDKENFNVLSHRLLMLRMSYYRKKRSLAIYRYRDDEAHLPFYHSSGASAATALLKTPVDGAFLTSGFGTRVDPFSGYTRQHKGTDFGAPVGTPIYAAGDGIVQKMHTVEDGYGNYVTIRHDARYRSLYAHLDSFAKSIKPGTRVKQGDVIGYVGSTGYSTGPHLHFEVLVNGVQVNSQKMELPSARHLTGTELMEFRALTRHYEKIYAALPHFQFAARAP